jgi:hypothetical protein
MGSKNDKDGARAEFDYDVKLRQILHDAYLIAAASMQEARKLAHDQRKCKGVSSWMHNAEKAIGEIIRLSPLCEDHTATASEPTVIRYEFELPENRPPTEPSA